MSMSNYYQDVRANANYVIGLFEFCQWLWYFLSRLTGSNKIYTITILKRTRDAIIPSILRQNDVMTSFWRNNDVIFASCVLQVNTHILHSADTLVIKYIYYSLEILPKSFIWGFLSGIVSVKQWWLIAIMAVILNETINHSAKQHVQTGYYHSADRASSITNTHRHCVLKKFRSAAQDARICVVIFLTRL